MTSSAIRVADGLDVELKMVFNYFMVACTRRLLATGDFALVEECACGSVHVTIGALTLRLTPDALSELASLLSEAAHTLVLDATTRCRPVQEALS